MWAVCAVTGIDPHPYCLHSEIGCLSLGGCCRPSLMTKDQYSTFLTHSLRLFSSTVDYVLSHHTCRLLSILYPLLFTEYYEAPD